MRRLFGYYLIWTCLVLGMSSCGDDFMTEYDTRDNEYSVCYNVTYSTVLDFHNIAYVSFTNFFDDDFKYTGKPKQIVHSIDGTEAYIMVERVPKGSHIEFSTFVDAKETLPNTKVEISIEIRKGGEIGYKEVAKAVAECPLKDKPLTIIYDLPNE